MYEIVGGEGEEEQVLSLLLDHRGLRMPPVILKFLVSFSQARSIKRSNNSCCLVHLILNLGPFLFLDFVPFRRHSKMDQEQGY